MSAPGEVVRIRINPRDCMGVADVVQQIGMNIVGMSFSQAASIALSALLESMRAVGKLPYREGYEYSDVMAPFVFKERTARKLAIARTFTYAGDEAQVPTLKPPPQQQRGMTTEQRQAKLRYNEMCLKRDAGEPFTQADEQEWTNLLAILSGD